MNNLLISIIVPIYNVEKYLVKSVNSIINQTYKNLEIILVNDGSTDTCGDICEKFKNIDRRIIVIHKKNGGLSDARNAGLQVAKGDYIGFVDSDDWIEKNMYQELLNISLKENSDIVSCGVRKVWNDINIINNGSELNYSNIYTFNNEEALQKLLSNELIGDTVWNKLYKSEIIKNIYFDVGKYHEDVFWTYRVIGNAKKISSTTKVFYNYLQRENSIMGSKFSEKRLDVLEALEARCEYINQRFPDLINDSVTSYMGECLYHYQWIKREKSDLNRQFCEDIVIKKINKFKNYNNRKYLNKNNKKQYIWIILFLYFPNLISNIRNKLKIGI